MKVVVCRALKLSSDAVKGVDWILWLKFAAFWALKLSSDVVKGIDWIRWLKVVAFRALKLSSDVVKRYRLDPLVESSCPSGTEVVK